MGVAYAAEKSLLKSLLIKIKISQSVSLASSSLNNSFRPLALTLTPTVNNKLANTQLKWQFIIIYSVQVHVRVVYNV